MSSIKNIVKLTNNLIQEYNKLDIKGKNYVSLYPLKSIKGIIIKECQRCNKQFIPPPKNRNQKFCSDDCRYNSTKETRKELKLDEKCKQVDVIRKKIYQRKYSLLKLGKEGNIKILDNLLIELKYLFRNRNILNNDEFNLYINAINNRYIELKSEEKL